MEVKGLLPIGSVVLLKEATKKMMIFGIKQMDSENTALEYDYSGVPYPEGNVGTETQYLFNHDDIETIVFKGYEDEEREAFIEVLDDFYKNPEKYEV